MMVVWVVWVVGGWRWVVWVVSGVGWCGWRGAAGMHWRPLNTITTKKLQAHGSGGERGRGGGRPDGGVGGVGGEGGVGWCGWRGAAGMHWRPLNTITTKKLQAHGSGGERGRGGGRPDGGVGGVERG